MLHEKEQNWNVIIAVYSGIIQRIRQVIKECPSEFDEGSVQGVEDSLWDNDHESAVYYVNSMQRKLNEHVGVFAQLDNPESTTGELRYIMMGSVNPTIRHFTGWILDYAGGGCYEEHWYVDGNPINSWDTQEAIEEFMEHKEGSRIFKTIYNMREELIEYHADTPHLKRAVTNTLDPITVGNTRFNPSH